MTNSDVPSPVKRMLKNIGTRVEENFLQFSTTLVDLRRAFFDEAVIATEITVFQILDDVGSISAKVDEIFTRQREHEWLSRQVSDAGMWS